MSTDDTTQGPVEEDPIEGESESGDEPAPNDPVESADSPDETSETASTRARASAAVKALKLARPKTPPKVREYILPLLTLGILTVLLVQFRTVLLPFVFACLLVYLMEPIVSRIGKTPDNPNGLPRWLAVISVYIVFIGIVMTSVVTIVPRFVGEFVRLGETLPDEVQAFRQESLPSIDERVQEFLAEYLPAEADSSADDATQAVQKAREAAAANALVWARATDTVKRASSLKVEARYNELGETASVLQFVINPTVPARKDLTLDESVHGSSWRFARAEEAAIRVVPERSGGFMVYLNTVEVDIEQQENGWLVKRHATDQLPMRRESAANSVSLQKSVDDAIGKLVDTSTERIANIIGFARALVIGIVQAFVALVLTLMVAAFISIDLYRVRRFFRMMVPESGREGFDVFLKMADRGLSGVVRGQLFICLINGVLTYIGLALIGVRFSVLLAVVAGILSLIPVFGTVLSTVPIVLIGLTDGFSTGFLALAWILAIHFVEANFLNPKIIGSAASIHPVIVIFALLAGENAYGLVGALLAVPTASLILTVFNFVRTRAWRVTDEEPEVVAA